MAGNSTEDFDPGFPDRVRERIRAALGSTWDRIEAADRRGQQASPPNPRRHVLAAIYENSGRFDLAEVVAQYPGRMPDLIALTAMANVLDRSREFAALPEMVASMAAPEDFRHHMLTLGLADLLRACTPYGVRLPFRPESGHRIVDLLLDHPNGQTMEIETKTNDEFEGPRREVSYSNARGAISRAWKKKVSGVRAQLGRHNPGTLLLGGVTLKVESLDVIRSAAKDWLSTHGRSHRNIWGIAVLTYWTYTLGPAPVFGTGEPVEIHARGGVQLRAAENPFYEGTVRIVLTPYVQEEAGT
jgi:hypothetical protein